MKKKQNQMRPALWLLVLCMLTAGAVLGKYVTTRTAATQTVQFDARLADVFVLQEHLALKQDSGEYTLSATELVTEGQPYYLLPGVDVPKDPHVVIEGVSEDIPAYLFIEVVNDLPNTALSYTLRSHWVETTLPLSYTTSGKVYVYSEGGSPKEIVGDATVYIIEGNMLYVGQKLLANNQPTNAITFYAYLEEAAKYKVSE